jgi:hypothetical protein
MTTLLRAQVKAQEETEVEDDHDPDLKWYVEQRDASFAEARWIQERVRQLLCKVRLFVSLALPTGGSFPSSSHHAQAQPGGPEEKEAWDLIQTIKLDLSRSRLEHFYSSLLEAVSEVA